MMFTMSEANSHLTKNEKKKRIKLENNTNVLRLLMRKNITNAKDFIKTCGTSTTATSQLNPSIHSTNQPTNKMKKKKNFLQHFLNY